MPYFEACCLCLIPDCWRLLQCMQFMMLWSVTIKQFRSKNRHWNHCAVVSRTWISLDLLTIFWLHSRQMHLWIQCNYYNIKGFSVFLCAVTVWLQGSFKNKTRSYLVCSCVPVLLKYMKQIYFCSSSCMIEALNCNIGSTLHLPGHS